MNSKDRQNNKLKHLKASNYKKTIKIRLKELKGGGLSIYLDSWHSQKRQYRFLNLYLTGDPVADDNTIRQAIKIRDIEEEQLKSQELGFSLSSWKQKADFGDYLDALAQKKKHNNWRALAKHFREFHPGKISFKQLSARLFEEFRDYLLDCKHQNTANLYITMLKTALSQARRDGIISTNPAQDVRVKTIQTERPFLLKEEVKRLEKMPCDDPEIKRAFLFACYTGLRYSDLVSLKWEFIKGDELMIRQEKTEQLITIPLFPAALRLLGKPSKGIIFNLRSETSGRAKLKKWIAAAGIDRNISWHAARHTCALMSLEAGVPLPILQKMLGHARIANTMRYLQIRDKAIRDGHRMLADYLDDDNQSIKEDNKDE